MTRLSKLIAIATLAFLAACATATFTQGREFSTDNIGQIVKGKTTATQLQQLFGPPFSKTVESDGKEIWIYTYTVGQSEVHNWVFTASVKTTGTQKTLNATIENGVVTAYSYTEGAAPGSN